MTNPSDPKAVVERLRAPKMFTRYHGDHLIEFEVAADSLEIEAAQTITELVARVEELEHQLELREDSIGLSVQWMERHDKLLGFIQKLPPEISAPFFADKSIGSFPVCPSIDKADRLTRLSVALDEAVGALERIRDSEEKMASGMTRGNLSAREMRSIADATLASLKPGAGGVG